MRFKFAMISLCGGRAPSLRKFLGGTLLAVAGFACTAAWAQSPAPTPWPEEFQPIAAKEQDGIVYFAFSGTVKSRIERYSLAAKTWLPSVGLTEAPTAMTADSGALYLSFGRRTSRFKLDVTGEVRLATSLGTVSALITDASTLYIGSGSEYLAVNKQSGVQTDSKSFFDSLTGFSIAPNLKKIFGDTQGVSPADIAEIQLDGAGKMLALKDSSYHGDYAIGNKTFVFPDESRVVDNSGLIYKTSDLTYSASLGGAFTDLVFNGDLPIVARDNVLTAYSSAMLSTGQVTLNAAPLKIAISGSTIFSFCSGSPRGLFVLQTPLDSFAPPVPGRPVTPTGRVYTPDAVSQGGDTIYLLSGTNRSIFRWSVSGKRYLSSIPLVTVPNHIATTSDGKRLYLSYDNGGINLIKPEEALTETPFANAPGKPIGLATAGEYVFVCDNSGAWATHHILQPGGKFISSVDWNQYSEEYIWSAATRKMYFFSDGSSPNDLYWEDIAVDGTIGADMETPYHDDEKIIHPIRVSPEGGLVVLGSGQIYNGLTLETITSLSNSFTDSVWAYGAIYSVRLLNNVTQVQAWTGVAYSNSKSVTIQGTPLRIFEVPNGLLVLVLQSGVPKFISLNSTLGSPTPTPTPTPSPTPTATPTPTPSATPTPFPRNKPPKVVIIEPSRNAKLPVGVIVTFTFRIKDRNPDDSVSRIELYDGPALVATATSGTSISTKVTVPGPHTYRVVVYDRDGKSGSDTVKIKVNP